MYVAGVKREWQRANSGMLLECEGAPLALSSPQIPTFPNLFLPLNACHAGYTVLMMVYKLRLTLLKLISKDFPWMQICLLLCFMQKRDAYMFFFLLTLHVANQNWSLLNVAWISAVSFSQKLEETAELQATCCPKLMWALSQISGKIAGYWSIVSEISFTLVKQRKMEMYLICMQSIREGILIMTYDLQHLKSFTTHHTPVHVV